MPLLQATGIILHFRGVAALSDVSLSVLPRTIHAIVGPNGAGKTSLLNCISGVYRPQRGTVRFDGQDVTRLPPSRRTALGIARTFQNIALFKGMTVLDNLLIGRHVHQRAGLIAGGVYFGPGEREEIAHRKVVEDVIDFLEIQHIRKKVVGTLAYGLQKRVELARALALELYASYQWDRSINGPLTAQGERDSRDPFGGFMIGEIDFLWDFNTFPINDELITTLGQAAHLDLSGNAPHVIMLVGLQGAGKTTAAGKLARMLQSAGERGTEIHRLLRQRRLVQPVACRSDHGTIPAALRH